MGLTFKNPGVSSLEKSLMRFLEDRMREYTMAPSTGIRGNNKHEFLSSPGSVSRSKNERRLEHF